MTTLSPLNIKMFLSSSKHTGRQNYNMFLLMRLANDGKEGEKKTLTKQTMLPATIRNPWFKTLCGLTYFGQ
jgi:hypothetical protein